MPTDTSPSREIARKSRGSFRKSVAYHVFSRSWVLLRGRSVATLVRRRRHHADQRQLVRGRRHAAAPARARAAAPRGQDRRHARLPRQVARLRLRRARVLRAAAARGVRRQPARGPQAAARAAQAAELAVRTLLALRADHGRDPPGEESPAVPPRVPQLGLAVRVAGQHGAAAAPSRALQPAAEIRRGQAAHGLRC